MKRFSLLITLSLLNFGCEERPIAPKIPNDIVIAEIGKEKVLASEFEETLKRIEEKTPQVPSTHPQKRDLLDQWINVELLYQAAMEEGFEKRFEFRAKLAEIYIENLAQKARASLSEEKLHAHYAKNKKSYDQIAARHILLKTTPEMPEREKVQIFQKLESLRSELIEKPEQFDEYARKYSEDSTSRQGGDLGYFTSDMMVPSFSKAAFALKENNSISPVVATPFGYHLIQLRGDRRGFDYHKNQIRENLIRQAQQERLSEEIARLRELKEIKIYEDELLKLSPLPDIIYEDPEKILPEKLPNAEPTQK